MSVGPNRNHLVEVAMLHRQQCRHDLGAACHRELGVGVFAIQHGIGVDIEDVGRDGGDLRRVGRE